MMFKRLHLSIVAATLAIALGAGAGAAQVRVVDVDAQPAQTDQPSILTADELDQLLGAIALYPDPLIAQLLPASTYPLDIVRAARLVRAGATQEQIDQQDWDPSVKAIAHYPTVLELLDSNLDWTQQLGQAFLAQPDDVMQSIQRLRQKAMALGNLTTTAQAQVLDEDGAICIVPVSPSVIYVPVYQPAIAFYERPTYGPCITFGAGFLLGAWFDLDCDWRHHVVYRPGWTWNHWHDNIEIDHNRIVRVRRPEFRSGEHPSFVWHRDEARPRSLPEHRQARPSDFDRFRGREPGAAPRGPAPHHVETPRPVPDRGREGDKSPHEARPTLTPGQPSSDAQKYRDRGHSSLQPTPAPVRPAPAPARPAPAGPVPARPAPAHPVSAPQPRPSPASVAKPAPQPRPIQPVAGPVRPTTPPAHIPTPPVKVAPPPAAARPAVPFTGRPSAPQPSSPSKDNSHKGRG